MVGVGLNITMIKEQGKVALWVWLLQIVLTMGFGMVLSLSLGYDVLTSIFISIALTFSSTIVIVKLLNDKDEEGSMYGKVAIGVLIVQDLVVMLVLMLIAAYGGSDGTRSLMLLEWVFLVILTIGFARYILPRFVSWLAKYEELLLLVGIGRCLLLGTLFQVVWFSFEIWCLLAWMSFASSPFRLYIMSKLKSLRDFFLVLFFIAMWLKLSWLGLSEHIWLLVGWLLAVIIIKPLVVYVSSLWFGYTHQVSLKAGMSLGQISEFWFLVLSIGLSMGYVADDSLMSLLVLIGLISIAVSSSVTMNNDRMFMPVHRWFVRAPLDTTKESLSDTLSHPEIVLFGYGRVWSQLSANFEAKKREHIVIDHNPALIDYFELIKKSYIFADATSVDIYKKLFHKELKMVVTTINDLEDDLFIIEQVRSFDPAILIVVVSNYNHHALQLYDAGADYVIMPDFLWAEHTSLLIEELGFDVDVFLEKKLRHINELQPE